MTNDIEIITKEKEIVSYLSKMIVIILINHGDKIKLHDLMLKFSL